MITNKITVPARRGKTLGAVNQAQSLRDRRVEKSQR